MILIIIINLMIVILIINTINFMYPLNYDQVHVSLELHHSSCITWTLLIMILIIIKAGIGIAIAKVMPPHAMTPIPKFKLEGLWPDL